MSDKERRESIAKLGEMIKGIRIAMLTTTDEDGTLRSRPMATQEFEFDGELWFFTRLDSPKKEEIDRRTQVNVSYADPDHQRYVSVSGRAGIVTHKEKIRKLWNPMYKAWFPEGLDDPNLALLKVTVEKAEYWDGPAGKLVMLVGFVKALVTGTEYRAGEHEKLEVR